jgi:hypothetical protein
LCTQRINPEGLLAFHSTSAACAAPLRPELDNDELIIKELDISDLDIDVSNTEEATAEQLYISELNINDEIGTFSLGLSASLYP